MAYARLLPNTIPRFKSSIYPRHGEGNTKEYAVLDAEHFLETLPMYYKRVLHKSLLEAVQESLEMPVGDQLSLLEELALIRSVASKTLEQYSLSLAAEEHFKQEGNELKINQARAYRESLAEDVVKQLQRVANFCKKASEVDANGRDKFSIQTVNSLIAQMTRLMFEVCEKNNQRQLAEDFAELVKTRLRVPRIGVEGEGTNITPSDDVLEMDATIPKSDVIDVE